MPKAPSLYHLAPPRGPAAYRLSPRASYRLHKAGHRSAATRAHRARPRRAPAGHPPRGARVAAMHRPPPRSGAWDQAKRQKTPPPPSMGAARASAAGPSGDGEEGLAAARVWGGDAGGHFPRKIGSRGREGGSVFRTDEDEALVGLGAALHAAEQLVHQIQRRHVLQVRRHLAAAASRNEREEERARVACVGGVVGRCARAAAAAAGSTSSPSAGSGPGFCWAFPSFSFLPLRMRWVGTNGIFRGCAFLFLFLHAFIYAFYLFTM